MDKVPGRRLMRLAVEGKQSQNAASDRLLERPTIAVTDLLLETAAIWVTGRLLT